jgi:Lon protease-like protein
MPLAGTVLFPSARLPLHISELRHAALVREVLSADRIIALALPQPGQPQSRHPDVHPLGCLGRIDTVTWLPDDCYHVQVVGLSRARLGRVVREFPYRSVQVSVVPQEPLSEDDPLVQMERRALIDAGARLAHAALGGAETSTEPSAFQSAGDSLTFESLVNRLCMGLGAAPAEQMALLEMDSLIERGRRARELLEARARWARRGGQGEHN